MPDPIRLDRDGAIATIRLQRPPVNAISTLMQSRLSATVAELAHDSVRAVVIYGGDNFAAGADITEFTDADPEAITASIEAMSRTMSELAALPQPVVAAVTGFALGAAVSSLSPPTGASARKAHGGGCRKSTSASSPAQEARSGFLASSASPSRKT